MTEEEQIARAEAWDDPTVPCQYRYRNIGICNRLQGQHRRNSHVFISPRRLADMKDAAEVLRGVTELGEGQHDGSEDVLELIDQIKSGQKIGLNCLQISAGIFAATLWGIIDMATPRTECPCCHKPSIVIPAYGKYMNCVIIQDCRTRPVDRRGTGLNRGNHGPTVW